MTVRIIIALTILILQRLSVEKKDYRIRQLGTATPYGCNDKIDGIGILSSPSCRSVNVMNIFNSTPRRRRSHGHRHYASPTLHDVSNNDLLPFIQKPLGIHHIRTTLYSLPLSKLHSLFNSCLETTVINPHSNQYKLSAIISDIASHRLFKPVCIGKDEKEIRSFLNLSFANKGLDGVTLGNIFHHTLVQSKIPQRPVCTNHFLYLYQIYCNKIFNYKHVLKDLNIDDFKSKPPDCCTCFQFTYNPAGHRITGYFNIVNNTSLQNVLLKGRKYRAPKSINWKYYFKILMDSVEDYARQWTKRKKEDVDTLSEWIKAVRSLIQIRIKKLKKSLKLILSRCLIS